MAVAGTFNGWDACAHMLTLGQDGWWSVTVSLGRGTHTYLFIVDGYPHNDPNDDGRAPCEWGGWYSVRVVR